MNFRRAIGRIGLSLAFAVSVSAQSPTADAVARDLQKKYDRVNDFSADFVHSYRGGVLKQQATERGQMMVKKPSQKHKTVFLFFQLSNTDSYFSNKKCNYY